MKKLTFIHLILLIFLGVSAHTSNDSEEILSPYSTDPVKNDKKDKKYVSLKCMNQTLGKSEFSGLTIFSTVEYQKKIHETRALLINKLSVDSMGCVNKEKILDNASVESRKLSYWFDLGIRCSVSTPSLRNSRLGEYGDISRKTATWKHILKSKMNSDTSNNTLESIIQEQVNLTKGMSGGFFQKGTQKGEEKNNIGEEDDVPSFGPKIGVSIPHVSTKQLKLDDPNGVDTILLDVRNAKIGFDIGIFGRVHVRKRSEFFIQSELYFSTKATAFKFENITSSLSTTVIERYYDLNLPIYFGAKYKMKDRLYVRPLAGFIFGKRFGDGKNLRAISSSYEQTFKKLNIGWQLGVGMDIGKMAVDLRYGGDFSKYANHMEFYGNDITFDKRGKQLEVSIGWSILKTKDNN